MSSDVLAAFDKIRRFHIYDHDEGRWLMSGASFSGKGCVIDHEYDDGLVEFTEPEVIVSEDDDLMLVWEDGPETDLEEQAVDMETAEMAARAMVDGLSERIGVEQDRLNVVALNAPNTVTYFVTPEAPEVGGV